MSTELDPETFQHFVEIPCDKCGTSASYAPHVTKDVSECFGCLCKRLEDEDLFCKCGWQGRYFEQSCNDNLQHICPTCGSVLGDETRKRGDAE